MPREVKPGPSATPARPSSFLSLMSGWVQQGVESFLATQRILVDVAMRQNANTMKTLREGLSDPEHSPLALMTEVAVEGTSSFIEAQKILLSLAQHENQIITDGVKQRVGGSTAAIAMTELVSRSVETFIGMQQEFLKTTRKQTVNLLEAAKAGHYDGTPLFDLAREGMEKFVEAQKKFLDIIAQEANKAMKGKDGTAAKMKKTELTQLAREATDAFVDAQKKLLDLMGQQMNVNLKTATRAMEMFAPSRLLPVSNLTGESVKNFVEAEKELLDTMMKPGNGVKPAAKAARRPRRAPRPRKATAQAAKVGA
jgi:hypothetical protein